MVEKSPFVAFESLAMSVVKLVEGDTLLLLTLLFERACLLIERDGVKLRKSKSRFELILLLIMGNLHGDPAIVLLSGMPLGF